MKVWYFFSLAFVLVSCSILPGAAEPTPAPAETTYPRFESLTFPGHLWTPFMPPPEAGTPTTVDGRLQIPAGTGRLPAVIITHGCGGISGSEQEWSRRLPEMGITTYMIFSFSARGIDGICRGENEVNIASILADVYAAQTMLAEHPRIDPERIAILGFSFGGRTALWSSLTRFQERYGGTAFAAYLAFYPAACYLYLDGETSVSGGPIRIFHGIEDDWIPIQPCRDYIGRLTTAGVDAAIYEYPGATHGFDAVGPTHFAMPNVLNPNNCVFVERDGRIVDSETGAEASIDAACVTRGGSSGYHYAAAQKAQADVIALLTDVFGLE